MIRELIGAQSDMTIPEVMARYLGERGIAVSEPAMRRTLKRMGLSRKKRRSSRPSVKARERSPRATSTSRGGSAGNTGG
jgi:transposase